VEELDNLASILYDDVGTMLYSAVQVSPTIIHLIFSDDMNDEDVQDISNYQLNGFSSDVESAYLLYGRKVVLILEDSSYGSSISISSLMDNNGNVVDPNYNSVDVQALAVNPHLVGTFNNWDPANHDHDFTLNDNGVWELAIDLPSGTYAYKVLESDIWNDNDWPGIDQADTLDISTEVIFLANCGFNTGVRNWDEFVTHVNPIVVGTFLDTLDLGANWDPLNIAGTMNDDDGDGIFTWEVLIPEGDWEYKVALNQNWDQDTQSSGGNLSVSSNGSSSIRFYYDYRQNYTYYIDTCPALGDLNGDGNVNVLDIVVLANCILSQDCADDGDWDCAGDMNGDGGHNVLDVVSLASCVLAENCGGRVDDASHSELIIEDNVVSIKADGFIGGVQMTLTHGDNFSIEMADRALFADYLTTGNETRLLVITPETDKLFSYSGDFKITEIIVANSQYEVSVDLPLATSFSLGEAYPNPFNPTTTMTLIMPVSGDMQVDVYNLLGQSVAILASGYKDAGRYNLTWDATDVSSGMYFVKAEADGFTKTQKLMLMK